MDIYRIFPKQHSHLGLYNYVQTREYTSGPLMKEGVNNTLFYNTVCQAHE